MGSWHGTCGVSQLPIFEGDAVRMMLVAIHNPVDTGAYYPSDLAFPFSSIMRGTYNGFGGVNFTDQSDVVGAWIIHAMNLDPTGKEWVDQLRNGALQLSRFGYKNNLTTVLWMVRDDVYRHMMTCVKSDDLHISDPSLVELHALAEQIVVSMSEISRQIRDIRRGSREDTRSLAFSACIQKLDAIRYDGHTLVGMAQAPRFRMGASFITNEVEKIVMSGAATEERIRPYFRALADYVRFINAMTVLRKTFGIQSGWGNSRSELKPHMEFAREITDIAAKMIRRREERDNE